MFSWVKKLVDSFVNRYEKANHRETSIEQPKLTTTHDYTVDRHCNTYVWETKDGSSGVLIGTGIDKKKGHFVILPFRGTALRYRIVSMSYYENPKAFKSGKVTWQAKLVFAPRSLQEYKRKNEKENIS